MPRAPLIFYATCLPVGIQKNKGDCAVKTLSFPVRCTREEYMQFCAYRQKGPAWTTAVGILMIAAAVLVCVLSQSLDATAVLLVILGAVLTAFSPLLLPLFQKGEAGRRYDNSDALKGSLMLTLDSETLTVKSVCQEGCVPLSALTRVWQTSAVTALEFGKELTVCIPMRSFSAEERALFEDFLAPYKKDR